MASLECPLRSTVPARSPDSLELHVFRWLLAGPGIACALLLGAAGGSEGIALGPLADQAKVDDYHFGSESMVGVGGWRYSSRTAYVGTSLAEALLMVCVVFFLVRGARGSSKWLLMGYLGLGAYFISMWAMQ